MGDTPVTVNTGDTKPVVVVEPPAQPITINPAPPPPPPKEPQVDVTIETPHRG